MKQEVLWSAQEAAEATGGRNSANWRATGVSIDTRSLRPGDLFVALKGPSFDGHDFIAKAFAAGAAAAMVHRPLEGRAGGPVLTVDDTLAALWRLGAAARARSQARFVGVTGSVGKTGTKEAIAKCLGAQASVSANLGGLNNHWGLPLSLARMSRQAVYGVFELGMNHPGELRDLSELLKPNVALITTVEAVHIGHFASVEEIADAKAEVFAGMTPEGSAVLNRDNPHFERLNKHARAAGLRRVITFGRHGDADVRAIEATLNAEDSSIRAEVYGAPVNYTISLPGVHWVANSLAVLATVTALGADMPAAASHLAKLTPVQGRGVRHALDIPGGQILLIDDAYNASPASMGAAFDVLSRAETGPGGRRIAVLGDMLELGALAAEAHRGLAGPLSHAGVDLVITCGSDMARLQDALPAAMRGGHAADSQAVVARVLDTLGPGDVILVKGSLGSRMAVVVDAVLKQDLSTPRAANGN